MHPDQQLSCWGTQAQSAWVGTHLDQRSGSPHLKPQVGAHLDQQLAAPEHRPKAGDQPRKWINGLAAHPRPHLKAPVLNNSHLAPAHRALQGLLALYKDGRMPSRGELQG